MCAVVGIQLIVFVLTFVQYFILAHVCSSWYASNSICFDIFAVFLLVCAVVGIHVIVFVLTFVQYFIPAFVNILIPSEVKIC
jgi:hypothetical protein